MDSELAPLSEEAIRRMCKTRLIGQRIVHLERTGSTNEIAKQLAEAGEPEGTVVTADEQLAGRGRFGRTWVAPARSSLLVSIVLRPTLTPSQIGRVTMALSLAACEGIRSETQLDARIKWPNDILVHGKKCAGILCEADTTGAQVEYLVCGLGLNANFHASTSGIPQDATTIADELGRPVKRESLLVAILTAFEGYYLRLKGGGALQPEWAARLDTLNRTVRAQTPWGEETGIAEAVDEDGALLLRRVNGSLVRLVSAEVTLLKG